MDAGYVDEDGYVFVVARDDDVINVAGHRYDYQKVNWNIDNSVFIYAECQYIQTCQLIIQIINRFSTSALEEVLLDHADVAEAAVVGVPDEVKGQIPVGLYVIKKDSERKDQVQNINNELIAKMRKDIGPVAAFRRVTSVSGLPKTRSGKTARKSISDLAAGKKVKIPPTIEDTSVYDNIREELERLGYKTQPISI